MTSPPAHPVLVADTLSYVDREPIACPAAPVLAGELRRRGVPTVRGPLGEAREADLGVSSGNGKARSSYAAR
jgi:4-hydroxy-3-methylbut-2-en-1-yl diphosphate reductase